MGQNYYRDGCARTETEENPFIKIDLGSERPVGVVEFYTALTENG